MNYRVTLVDDNGNKGDVVVRRVEFDGRMSEYYVQIEGVGPTSYPSWVTKDEYDEEMSFTSKGPSMFLSESCPIRIDGVEPTTDALTQPSFDF